MPGGVFHFFLCNFNLPCLLLFQMEIIWSTNTSQVLVKYHWGKDHFHNKGFWEDWITTCRDMKLDPFLTLLTKSTSKWVKDLCKTPKYQTPRRKTGKVSLTLVFTSTFWMWLQNYKQNKKCWLEQTVHFLGNLELSQAGMFKGTKVILGMRPWAVRNHVS